MVRFSVSERVGVTTQQVGVGMELLYAEGGSISHNIMCRFWLEVQSLNWYGRHTSLKRERHDDRHNTWVNSVWVSLVRTYCIESTHRFSSGFQVTESDSTSRLSYLDVENEDTLESLESIDTHNINSASFALSTGNYQDAN
ncbi:hypothetical protein Tco_0947789 [Tanacetum coccineum]